MLMGDFNFRPIEQKDNAAIAELIRKTLKAYALDIPGTVYFDEGLDHLSDVYSGKDCAYYVIDDKNGKLIGGVGFARLLFMKDTAELQKLYLDESMQGAGLGYEMLDFIETEMRKAGFKRSYLETHDNLKAAIHIYEKSAYILIDRPAEVVHSTMNRFYLKDL